MSRFRKLSQTIWHCHYHIVWVPKYRLRILEGTIAVEVENYIRAFFEQQSCEVESNSHCCLLSAVCGGKRYPNSPSMATH